MFLLTLLLIGLASAGILAGSLNFNPSLAGALRISIIFLGVGAVVFRRTRFSAMRLQDVAALRGASGLLETLQRTTIYVALAGGLIALLGFVMNMMTGIWTDMLWLGVIAIAVLLYAYPRRAAWQSVVVATGPTPVDTGRAAKGTIA
jgi:hypothetical protein